MSNFAQTQQIHMAIYMAHRTVDTVQLPNQRNRNTIGFIFKGFDAETRRINCQEALFGLAAKKDLQCGTVNDLAQLIQRLSIVPIAHKSILKLPFGKPEEAEAFAEAYFKAVYTEPFMPSMADLKNLSSYAIQHSGYQPPTVKGTQVILGPLISDELKKRYVETLMYLREAQTQDLSLQSPAERRLKAAMGDFSMSSTWGDRNGFDLFCRFNTEDEAIEFAAALHNLIYNS